MRRETPAEFLAMTIDEEFPLAPPERLAVSLAELSQVLDAPDAKRDFSRLRGFSRFNAPGRLSGTRLAEAESLLLRVIEATGASKVNLEEGLLRTLAFTASPTSLPLFERLLDYTRPRDQFTTTRRTWCIAGIALLATRHRHREAARRIEAVLRESPDKRLRLAAVDAVARLWRTAEDDLDADAITLLAAAAGDDRDFEPRFAARGWLAETEHDAGNPVGDGVLAFKATSGRASRTIEVLATQTLVDLVSAVVSAFSWDHDHLWALTLSTEFEQDDFRVSPEGDPWDVEDGPAAVPIGALRMPVGHRCELLYDFGCRHRVALQLVDLQPSPKPRAKYPRVAASVGKAPSPDR